MFEARKLMFIYVETPLHAGSGKGLGAVDLPIQRERATNYPMLQASGVKGRLRAAVREEKGWKDDSAEITTLFGKAGESGENHAGAVAPGDARILLFPVRSLAGVFAWTTCVHVLNRFKRDCEIAGVRFDVAIPDAPDGQLSKAWVSENAALKAGSVVVLEEFSYEPQVKQEVAAIGKWIADHALPDSYSYWKNELPHKLIILPDDHFRDFVSYATEVQTHVRLDTEKKTVQQGALWTTESLPLDTLLYAPLLATRPRANGNHRWQKADDVLKELEGVLDGRRLQMGGDETTGQGWVSVKFAGGQP